MAAAQPSPRGMKSASFLQLVLDLLQELPGLISDRVHLLTLELQRARQALGQMIALAVAAALLALTAWFVFWIGLTAAAVEAGLAWGWMLLLVLALNVGGAWAAVTRIRRLAGLLAFPATTRRLTIAPTATAHPAFAAAASRPVPPSAVPSAAAAVTPTAPPVTAKAAADDRPEPH